jgi:hypothetical protein
MRIGTADEAGRVHQRKMYTHQSGEAREEGLSGLPSQQIDSTTDQESSAVFEDLDENSVSHSVGEEGKHPVPVL